MAGTTVPPICDAGQVKDLLGSPEVASLIAELEATRWTGRPGYPIRATGTTASTSLIAAAAPRR